MNYQRFVSKHTYTVKPGREIYRDGKPFIKIARHEGFDPQISSNEIHEITKDICKFLNERDENKIA